MAQIRLNVLAAETGKLPPVCFCCGQPAQQRVVHKIYYAPAWLILLALTGMKRTFWHYANQHVQFPVPVCNAHTRRLQLPRYVGFAFALSLLVSVPLVPLCHYLEWETLGGVLFFGLLVYVPTGLIAY